MIFLQNNLQNVSQVLLKQIQVGTEIEKLRVDENDHLSQTTFPTNLEKTLDRFIEKEFFVAQTEFKFPPITDPEQNVILMNEVVKETNNSLTPGEKLWNFSTPPALTGEETELKITNDEELLDYRIKLAQIYDPRRILNCGVHLNISFSQPLIALLKKQFGYRNADQIYLQVAQYFSIHRWFLTYLFGATPIVDSSYSGDHIPHPMRSVRSSHWGFPTNIHGDFSSVTNYVEKITGAIENGELLRPGQFYDSVRLKSGNDKSLQSLLQNGITHLELRTFDQNPNEIAGVTADQIRLVQVMAIFFATQPSIYPHELHEKQIIADEINEIVATEDPRKNSLYQRTGVMLLSNIFNFALQHQLGAKVYQTIDQYINWFLDSQLTTAAQALKLQKYMSEAS